MLNEKSNRQNIFKAKEQIRIENETHDGNRFAISWKQLIRDVNILPDLENRSLSVIRKFIGYLPGELVYCKYSPFIRSIIDNHNKGLISYESYFDEVEFFCLKIRNDDIIKYGGAKYKEHAEKDYKYYETYLAAYKTLARHRLSNFLGFEPDVQYSLYAETFLRHFVSRDGFYLEMPFADFDFRAASIYVFRELLLKEGLEAAEAAPLYGLYHEHFRAEILKEEHRT